MVTERLIPVEMKPQFPVCGIPENQTLINGDLGTESAEPSNDSGRHVD